MEADRWTQLKEHFHTACELDDEAREQYVEQVRSTDADEAHELQKLLDAETRTGGPLDRMPQDASRLVRDEPTELLGTRVGPWTLRNVIASGGTSDVYGAEPADGGGGAVAIKVLHRGLVSREALRRFALEEETLAAMRHPNIVAFMGAETLDDGRPALVMEYVRGAPIDEHCRTAGLDTRGILALFADVCSALRYAHRSLIVHRDLKPQNILVEPDGTPKVLDFGVVKLLAPDRGDETTHPGSIAPMTLRYASPEQEHGRPVSTVADVYSLGVVLAELIDVTCEALPRDLSLVLATATEHDPDLRYSSVEAFGDDLERFLNGEPVRARRGSGAYRLARFVGRHRISVAISCGLLLLLLVALGFLNHQWRRAQRAEALGWQAHGEALQVSSFFERLLDAADSVALARDSGMLRILEETAASVGEDLSGFPEAEGRLRYSIARLYARLGRADDARLHGSIALELASEHGGFDGADRDRMRALLQQLE